MGIEGYARDMSLPEQEMPSHTTSNVGPDDPIAWVRGDGFDLMKRILVLEGYLNLVCQEGGYAGPDWELSGSSLADKVVEIFGMQPVEWGTPDWRKLPHHIVPGDVPVGRVRITIERLD